MTNNIIIDGGYMYHRTKNIPFYRRMNIDGKPLGIAYGIMRTINKLKKIGYNRIDVVWEGTPYHRLKIAGDYKGDRQKSMEHDKTDKEGRAIAKEFIGLYGIPQYYHPQYEADDTIACLTKNYSTVDIYTADKDLYQLITNKIRVLRPDTDEFANPVVEFGVKPADIPMFLALIGDKVDGIVGCAGIGKKTASKYINMGISSLTERQRRIIEDNAELIARNLKMIKLVDDFEPRLLEYKKDIDELKSKLESYGFLKHVEELFDEDRMIETTFDDFIE